MCFHGLACPSWGACFCKCEPTVKHFFLVNVVHCKGLSFFVNILVIEGTYFTHILIESNSEVSSKVLLLLHVVFVL